MENEVELQDRLTQDNNGGQSQSPHTCACQKDEELSRPKKLYGKFLVYWLPLLVSIVASVFAILSVLASWKAQAAANKANDWAYLSYNASVVQIRLAVMQLCVDNPPLYNSTCVEVNGWNYLPSVITYYNPDGVQGAPIVPSPIKQRLSSTNVAVTVLGVALGSIPLVAVAVLASGWWQFKRSGAGPSH